jgi:hypothetical protein
MPKTMPPRVDNKVVERDAKLKNGITITSTTLNVDGFGSFQSELHPNKNSGNKLQDKITNTMSDTAYGIHTELNNTGMSIIGAVRNAPNFISDMAQKAAPITHKVINVLQGRPNIFEATTKVLLNKKDGQPGLITNLISAPSAVAKGFVDGVFSSFDTANQAHGQSVAIGRAGTKAILQGTVLVETGKGLARGSKFLARAQMKAAATAIRDDIEISIQHKSLSGLNAGIQKFIKMGEAAKNAGHASLEQNIKTLIDDYSLRAARKNFNLEPSGMAADSANISKTALNATQMAEIENLSDAQDVLSSASAFGRKIIELHRELKIPYSEIKKLGLEKLSVTQLREMISDAKDLHDSLKRSNFMFGGNFRCSDIFIKATKNKISIKQAGEELAQIQARLYIATDEAWHVTKPVSRIFLEKYITPQLKYGKTADLDRNIAITLRKLGIVDYNQAEFAKFNQLIAAKGFDASEAKKIYALRNMLPANSKTLFLDYITLDLPMDRLYHSLPESFVNFLKEPVSGPPHFHTSLELRIGINDIANILHARFNPLVNNDGLRPIWRAK